MYSRAELVPALTKSLMLDLSMFLTSPLANYFCTSFWALLTKSIICVQVSLSLLVLVIPLIVSFYVVVFSNVVVFTVSVVVAVVFYTLTYTT